MSAEPAMIDRKRLVTRHNPSLREAETLSPLTVGNGRFCFTADITGTQSLDAAYARGCPLCTMAGWGWHRFPEAYNRAAYRMPTFDVQGRKVPYLLDNGEQPALYNGLRMNPHKFHLGRVRLLKEGVPVQNIAGIRQTLDLWTGVLHSEFTVDGQPVSVKTAVHPQMDALAIQVETNAPLTLSVDFPYASEAMPAGEFILPGRHASTLDGGVIRRAMDTFSYEVFVEGAAQTGLHAFSLPSTAVLLFSPSGTGVPPTAEAVFSACEAHWPAFWQSGGALEIAHNEDPRALELERRVVLSQYLLAIQCADTLPPQETGLTCNSWYGKFHLEMHWWHGVHFGYWGRLALFEKSLTYYRDILPRAREIAASQGYKGARWPKMTDASGLDSPSPIGPMLCWQQPHPIYYAELCRTLRPGPETLARYAEIVYATAEFMADYAHLGDDGFHHLGPPLIPAQECWAAETTCDPPFELAYWRFALRRAISWMEAMDRPVPDAWRTVLEKMAPLPVMDGLYPAVASENTTFTRNAVDHPSMLCALGMLDGEGVDPATMSRTLDKVMSSWNFSRAWGWDFPVLAMCATRLGRGEEAVDLLLKDAPKNAYLPSGHNYQRADLPLYLPGNGGLLTAVAMMAAGYAGSSEKVPGFPKAWDVRVEGLEKVL